MGFNFPDAPTIGQLHPTPAVVGIPQYQWNGSEWVTPEYNPLNYVLKSGDTMLGALNVVTPPTQAAHAASKSYVDTYAAPLDALAYSGMQINGSFEVSQEKAFDSPSTGHLCDGWILASSGTMVAPAGAYSAAITAGIPHCLAGVVTTAQPSMGALDYSVVYQVIEGYRIARLGWGAVGARPITLAFWCKHTRIGTYSGTIRNQPNTRSYAFTYTQNVADATEYKTITIPGCVDGTWNWQNAAGMLVTFTRACGTTYTAPSANTWLAANYLAAPGQVNAVTTTGDIFRLTGVVVLPGIYAPTAAQSPLIMRSFDQEIEICQRYYWKTFDHYQRVMQNSATIAGCIMYVALVGSGTLTPSVMTRFPVRMRSVPSIAFYSTSAATNQWQNFRAGTASGAASVPNGWGISQMGFCTMNGYQVAGDLAGDTLGVHASADARLS